MNKPYGTFWERISLGVRWTWTSDSYHASLPPDLASSIMSLESKDRLHAKQGRSTARVRFDLPTGPLSVYLKRHYQLPWISRVLAMLNPSGKHTPGATELAHLDRARALGIRVPDAVAAGEWIGPWGTLQSFLMVAELIGCRELNEILPELKATLDAGDFERLKRKLIDEMATITTRLHRAHAFHKDLYLCHFFLDPSISTADQCLTLIDLHRLSEHRLTGFRWRWKDLAQLLYSTYSVECITDRDRLRFWKSYRRQCSLTCSRWQRKQVVAKAARYRKHNTGG
jgi:heptose I phosphotransferase